MTELRTPRRAHCEWGLEGLSALAESSDLFVVVDVLSFSTTVEVALSRGASVFPASEDPEEAARLATQVHAELAGPRGSGAYSLSPRSMQEIPAGTRIVLPSVNGAALSLAAAKTKKPVWTAALRNAPAVGRALSRVEGRIAVLPAGERRPDGTLRFALEDWLGAGALLAHLDATLSAEAEAAVDSFRAASPRLLDRVTASTSGRELVDRGYPGDVELAAEFDVSTIVPELDGKSFVLGPRGALGSVRRRFFSGSRLKEIPAKKSDRDAVLAEIMAMLPVRAEYAERDLNALLQAIHPDFCTLRRDLVDAGLLRRAAGIYRIGSGDPGTDASAPPG